MLTTNLSPEKLKECHQKFKEHWANFPDQDNEGYLPDRAGFKCGWFDAFRYRQQEINELKAKIKLLEEKDK